MVAANAFNDFNTYTLPLSKSLSADLVKGTSGGMSIYDLVTSGISYLDTRTEFWRQQKPMYARKRDRALMNQKWSNRKKADSSYDEPTKSILNNLEEIDQGTGSLTFAVPTLLRLLP